MQPLSIPIISSFILPLTFRTSSQTKQYKVLSSDSVRLQPNMCLKTKTNPAFGRHANLKINGLTDGTIYQGVFGFVLGLGFFCLFFSCFKSSILAESEAATTQKPTNAHKYTSMQMLTFVQLYKDCNITATEGRMKEGSLQQVTVTKKYNSRSGNFGLMFKKRKPLG